MTGSIRARDLANGERRYDAIFRDSDNRQKWRTFKRRKDAEKFLAGTVKAVHDGVYEDVQPIPMADVFTKWTAALDTRVKQGTMKKSTVASYKSMIAVHLKDAFGAIRSDRLRPAALADWAAGRAEDIATGTLAAKTFNNLVNARSAITTWARHPAQAFMAHDPMIGLRRVPRSKIERTFLAPAQIPVLLTAAKTVRDSTLLAVVAYSGLRRGEIFGLQWADVDQGTGRLRVCRSLVQGVLSTPKTATSTRTIDVPDSVLRTLAIYRACYPCIGEGFIFRDDQGRPLDSDNWSKRVFADIVTRAQAEGLPAVGLHALRHTYASLLANKGEPMLYVSRQLGHANIAITMDLYSHLFPETGRAAMGRLDDGIDAAFTAGGKVLRMPRTGTAG